MNKIYTFGAKCKAERKNAEGKQDGSRVLLAISQSKGAKITSKGQRYHKDNYFPQNTEWALSSGSFAALGGFGFGGRDGTGRGCAFTGGRVLATGGCQ